MHTSTAPPQSRAPTSAALISTGVTGLDEVFGGGLAPNRLYLIQGVPGVGKTTLALQYMLEGVKQGEPALYITLSETKEELVTAAASHGWSLERVHIREVLPSEASLDLKDQYTVFHPAEVELSETTKAMLREVEKIKPTRVVLDSISELRLLSGGPLHYRRQLLALKQFFTARGCTVLVLDDLTSVDHELQGESIVHGVLRMEQMNREYGPDRRRLKIVKFRGSEYNSGYHDFSIDHGGLIVFPRFFSAAYTCAGSSTRGETLSSGVEALDALLGGGLERGTSTLITGPPGSGKSSLAAQFVAAAAKRGQSSSLFIFDESIDTLLARTEGISLGLKGYIETGLVTIQQIDSAEMSPGEFAHIVCRQARAKNASVIVIDSLNGYLNSMPDERFLILQLRELLTCLRQLAVVTLLVGVHKGVIDMSMTTGADASYLADGIILLRFFETDGEIRQAISVLKKRWGGHERTLRELKLTSSGVHLGEPLREFRGVLTGTPVYQGTSVGTSVPPIRHGRD